MEFEAAYKGLNDQQKQAVDKIDGPVLVIAGPGTGKTQLLALRAAQILKKDPTMLPGNILCLTFTDNAADNMRQRLITYIGQDAYQIAIHTFNSFGNYVMNVYPEYFYEWRETRTADELTSYRLLEEIMAQLPGNHILAARGQDGTFFSLGQLRNFIYDAKRANLTPADLGSILDQNSRTLSELTPLMQEFWPARLSASAEAGLTQLVSSLASLKPDLPPVAEITPLKNMIIRSLALAAAEAGQEAKFSTKPFTAWRGEWLERNKNNELVFKAEKAQAKLRAAINIYEKYQQRLADQGMADFSDQIAWVLRAIGANADLRLNLQERFNYIMLDEFQDTNRAQLMLARSLTQSLSQDEQPNILAVGDDDQAIFRFQGADIGNVALFETEYRNPLSVTLVENYRSNQQILDAARAIGRQIELSLEKQSHIKKELKANTEQSGRGPILNEFTTEAEHNSWIAQEIKRLLENKVSGSEIAVLGRERAQLDALVPYLRNLGIPIKYERRENVLEQPHILLLNDMAHMVYYLATEKMEQANELLAKILSEPMWQIPPKDLWQISRTAYREKKFWLDVIFEQVDGQLVKIADFFMELAAQSSTLPFEQILDRLVGIHSVAAQEEQDDTLPLEIDESAGFISPFKEYFFKEQLLAANANEYLKLLSNLSTLRRHLRSYQAEQKRTLVLADLVSFIDSYQRTGLFMLDEGSHCEDGDAVQLMTIHKAKGLEFDNVFILGVQEGVWTKKGDVSGRFSYPANLTEIKPSGNQPDDALRLLYVAMTRARQTLFINYYLQAADAKAQQPYAPLMALEMEPKTPDLKADAFALASEYEQRWLNYHGSLSKAEMSACLEDTLSKYSLSATHLNNFTDITSGGPLFFLTQNLLNFPHSKSPSAVYGSAIHSTLRFVHESVKEGKPATTAQALANFSTELSQQNLEQSDKEHYLKKGEEILALFLEASKGEFSVSQVVEFDFRDQGVNVGPARLRGLIDRMDFDASRKTVIVTDYKTGSAASKWQPPSSAAEYERIKLHRYRQQLLFYKVLVDGSNEWGRRGWRAESGILKFVEPDNYGRLRQLSLEYDQTEISRFKQLIKAVWHKIQNLDFPDTSIYPPTLDGILAFENDLIK